MNIQLFQTDKKYLRFLYLNNKVKFFHTPVWKCEQLYIFSHFHRQTKINHLYSNVYLTRIQLQIYTHWISFFCPTLYNPIFPHSVQHNSTKYFHLTLLSFYSWHSYTQISFIRKLDETALFPLLWNCFFFPHFLILINQWS